MDQSLQLFVICRLNQVVGLHRLINLRGIKLYNCYSINHQSSICSFSLLLGRVNSRICIVVCATIRQCRV